MKKKLYCPVIFLCFFLYGILAAGCSNTDQTMLDDYNSNFTPKSTTDESSIPGNDGFDETNMLDVQYLVNKEGTLSITGPENCTAYTWTAVRQDSPDSTAAVLGTDCQLLVYLPDTALKDLVRYVLTLKVTTDDGTEYSDSALLLLY